MLKRSEKRYAYYDSNDDMNDDLSHRSSPRMYYSSSDQATVGLSSIRVHRRYRITDTKRHKDALGTIPMVDARFWDYQAQGVYAVEKETPSKPLLAHPSSFLFIKKLFAKHVSQEVRRASTRFPCLPYVLRRQTFQKPGLIVIQFPRSVPPDTGVDARRSPRLVGFPFKDNIMLGRIVDGRGQRKEDGSEKGERGG